jgi:choline dehydrogenase-like flavoprotein
MTESSVAIVGSGIVGTAMAYHLAEQEVDVAIFEKGPDYPYPHGRQFRERILYLYDNPAYRLPQDLQHLTRSGDYRPDLNAERVMVVGGSATVWQAITLRMLPAGLQNAHPVWPRRRLAAGLRGSRALLWQGGGVARGVGHGCRQPNPIA